MPMLGKSSFSLFSIDFIKFYVMRKNNWFSRAIDILDNGTRQDERDRELGGTATVPRHFGPKLAACMQLGAIWLLSSFIERWRGARARFVEFHY